MKLIRNPRAVTGLGWGRLCGPTAAAEGSDLSEPPRWRIVKVIDAHLSLGDRSSKARFVDLRKTGNDQPNVIARPRTVNVTMKPAIIAARRPTPSSLSPTYAHTRSTDAVT